MFTELSTGRLRSERIADVSLQKNKRKHMIFSKIFGDKLDVFGVKFTTLKTSIDASVALRIINFFNPVISSGLLFKYNISIETLFILSAKRLFTLKDFTATSPDKCWFPFLTSRSKRM